MFFFYRFFGTGYIVNLLLTVVQKRLKRRFLEPCRIHLFNYLHEIFRKSGTRLATG
jgi:hypothetical protein